MSACITPDVVCVYYKLLSAYEGSIFEGGGEKALQKINAKTNESGVESDTIKVADVNADI